MEQLEVGGIDLMAGLAYTDERAALIDYPELSMGEERFYIFSRLNQDGMRSGDPSGFDGKKVAVHTGCYAVTLLAEWCAKNNVEIRTVEYEDTAKCLEALVDGEVDAVADSENYLNRERTPLIYLGQDEYFFGVAKDRSDLSQQLDDAMQAIKSSNFFYEDELRVKYLSNDAGVALPLSEEEQAWIEEIEKVRVGYLDRLMPYCEQNDDTGENDGMLVDLMEDIHEIYGIDYELVPYSGYEQLAKALSDGEVDAIFPIYGEYYIGETEQMMVSDPVTVSTMTLLNHRSADGAQEVAAVTKSSPFQQYVLENYYPDVRVIYCDSIADCIETVLDGDADFTMMETAITNERVDADYRKQLQTVELPIDVNISFGVGTGSRQLLAILNKSITMEQSQIDTSLIQHSQTHVIYTAKDFIRDGDTPFGYWYAAINESD
jgi:ABC-type amino acid transport substrate-binding protein